MKRKRNASAPATKLPDGPLEVHELASRRWIWCIAFGFAAITTGSCAAATGDARLRGHECFAIVAVLAAGGALLAAVQLPSAPKRRKLELTEPWVHALVTAGDALARQGVRAAWVLGAPASSALETSPFVVRLLAESEGALGVRSFEVARNASGADAIRRLSRWPSRKRDEPPPRFVFEHRRLESLAWPFLATLTLAPLFVLTVGRRIPSSARALVEIALGALVAALLVELSRGRPVALDARGLTVPTASGTRVVELAEVVRVERDGGRRELARVRLRGGAVVRVPCGHASPAERAGALEALERAVAAASGPRRAVPVAALRGPSEPVAAWIRRLRAHADGVVVDHRTAPVERAELEAIALDARAPAPLRVAVTAALAADPTRRAGLRVAELERDDPAAQGALALAASGEALDDAGALERLEAAVEALEARELRAGSDA